MAWYDEAVFYHIYPLGMTGAPKQNAYEAPQHRLNTLLPWISHIKNIGCNAIYIGPLFESVGHGYETTDYKKLDSRLGTNEDLTGFVKECHAQGIRVILDGVFNHTGRDFFAFQDLKNNRENSPYKDWYCNVNFGGNNEYNDGFSYENWGGYNLLVKLNQHNPAVRDYICDVIRFWVKEFDIDGIRLDAADVLDFNYMQALRKVADEVKEEFWLMGEVIHGDYSRWANENTLHSVTNYQLHKALYSGHNDHNYYEIAHTVKRLYELGGSRPDGLKLYNFVDNHDVERIYTKLSDKGHFTPVHIMLYTLPGIPSLYYGSEFGIEGKKEQFSDDSLRPALSYEEYAKKAESNPYVKLISALGRIRQHTKALSYGDFKELLLTNCQYAFSRNYNGTSVLVAVNNSAGEYTMTLPAGNCTEYIGALSGEKVSVNYGQITVSIKGNSGEIYVPADVYGSISTEDACNATKDTCNSTKDACNADKSSKNGADNANITVEPEEQAESKADATAVKEASFEVKDTCKEMQEATKSEAAAALQEEGATVSGEENVTASDSQEAFKTQLENNAQEGVNESNTAKSDMGESETAPNTDKTESKLAPKADLNKPLEEMTVEELQQKVLECMAKNGPITDEMRRTVEENVYHDSLVTWVRSFR